MVEVACRLLADKDIRTPDLTCAAAR